MYFKNENMKKYLMAVGIAVLVSIPIILSVHLSKRRANHFKSEEYDKLKTQSKEAQQRYDQTIKQLEDSIATLNEQIQFSESKLTAIKNKRNEKIIRINKLTTDELSRAITDNYKGRIVD